MAAEQHRQEVGTLTLKLSKALAVKQVPSPTSPCCIVHCLSHLTQHFDTRHDVLDCSSACLLCSHVTLAAPVMCLAAFRSYQLSHVSVMVYVCVWCHMSSTQPKYGVQALQLSTMR